MLFPIKLNVNDSAGVLNTKTMLMILDTHIAIFGSQCYTCSLHSAYIYNPYIVERLHTTMHNQFPLLEDSFIIPLACFTEIPSMISLSIIFPAFNGPIILSMSDIFSFISCSLILNYFGAHGSRFISKCFHSPFPYQGGRGIR